MHIPFSVILSTLLITGLYAGAPSGYRPNILTFNTYQINAASAERDDPLIIHKLDLNHRETNTKKPFNELLNNAHQMGLPWIVAPITTISYKRGLTMEYLDLIELLRHEYGTVTFSSELSFTKAVENASQEFARRQDPTLLGTINCDLWHVYLSESGNSLVMMSCKLISQSDQATLSHTPQPTHHTSLSNARCCAAIRLHGDYSKALILANRCPDEHATLNEYFLKCFWINFCNNLPSNIKKKLHEEKLE